MPKNTKSKKNDAKPTISKSSPPEHNQDKNKTLKIVCCSLGGCCGCIVLIIIILWLFSFFGIIAPGFWPSIVG